MAMDYRLCPVGIIIIFSDYCHSSLSLPLGHSVQIPLGRPAAQQDMLLQNDTPCYTIGQAVYRTG